jgi:hypothetical protein
MSCICCSGNRSRNFMKTGAGAEANSSVSITLFLAWKIESVAGRHLGSFIFWILNRRKNKISSYIFNIGTVAG